MKIVFFGLLSFFLIGSLTGEAASWYVSASVTGGYRNDEITNLINSYDQSGTLLFTDHLKANNISIYEAGGRGCISFCKNWFIKGFANFGQVDGGSFNDVIQNVNGTQTHLTASIKGGDTKDGSIGLGYLYPLKGGFYIGPIAGWAYNSQNLHMQQAAIDGSSFQNFSYDNRLEGPWVGLESLFSCFGFKVHAGYQYRWTNWHAGLHLSGPDAIVLTDTRKSHCGSGNLGFIDLNYCLFSYIELGLGFKYQEWTAKNGSRTPAIGTDKIASAKWQSS
jgi:hypothetical protein